MPGDLDDAIREALEDPQHEDWCDLPDAAMQGDDRACNCFMGPRTAALVAALDLHKPEAPYTLMTEYRRCVECSMRDVTAIEWPCPTVQAIVKALGVTERTDQ